MNVHTVRVGNLKTAILTSRELAEVMVRDCHTRTRDDLPKLIFSSNGQGVSLAGRQPSFLKAMESADLIHADGMSVVMASKLLTKSALPERISTTDFFEDAAREACKHNLSFFFLGGSEAQNKQAVAEIQLRYPGLRIAGRQNGYFLRDEDESVCRKIRASGADVLWVGLGKPLQEHWSVDNKAALVGVGWIKTCGGLYGHLAKEEKRAPRWMQQRGLEWLFRMYQNPRRLAWRYLVTSPHAIFLMTKLTG